MVTLEHDGPRPIKLLHKAFEASAGLGGEVTVALRLIPVGQTKA